jgi:hypothetical protein
MKFFTRLGNLILIIAYLLFILLLVGGKFGGILLGFVLVFIAVAINYLITGKLTLFNLEE